MNSIYGQDIPISVISIETKVFTVVINIIVGLAVGAQPVLGYNYGAKKYKRVKEAYKMLLICTSTVGVISTIVFELFPQFIIKMFGSGSQLYNEFANMTFRIFLSLVLFTCITKMTSIFFQAVGAPIRSLIVSIVRDIILFVPLIFIFSKMFGIKGILLAAPVADAISIVVVTIMSVNFFRGLNSERNIDIEDNQVIKKSKRGIIITISRQHGSAGKYIGQLVAKKLKVPCYYKETTALAAKESGLDRQFISDINKNSPSIMHDLYLSTNVIQQAIIAQEQIIKKIANEGACVIIGRAADYVLKDYDNVVNIFIYAPKKYRIKKIQEMYGDSEEEAKKSLKKSDMARSAYYKNISDMEWENINNYDICIDSSIGINKTVNVICNYIKNIKTKK